MEPNEFSGLYRGYIACLNEQDWPMLGTFVHEELTYNGADIRLADLYDLACRLAGARVFIGNDSGIAHLTAAVDTPVVALFGPTDPRVWAPRGRDVRVVQGTELADISIADVLAATLK